MWTRPKPGPIFNPFIILLDWIADRIGSTCFPLTDIQFIYMHARYCMIQRLDCTYRVPKPLYVCLNNMIILSYTSIWLLHMQSDMQWRQQQQTTPLQTCRLRAMSHGSQVLSPKSLEVNPCNLSRWEFGSWDLLLYTGLKSLVSSMTWMSTWQHSFGGEVRLGTCVESWPNSRLKSCEYFCIKYAGSNFNDMWSCVSGVLRLKSWDIASMLGLA